MPKIIIIADDLTGANATGVLLARKGYRAATFLNLDKYDNKENSEIDIVSINTDSRAVRKEEAYARVAKIVKFFDSEGIILFTKRIDSTLRGNIGAETLAILDNVRKDTIAIVVPSFPSSGRICVGGYLIVNQIPLEKTDVSSDPKNPILKSRVVNLLEEQVNEEIGFIELNKVLRGVESIKNALLNENKKGHRIIVVDATTDEDILKIARAVKETELNVISVDPGPFSAALAQEYMEITKTELGQKVMFTIGSISKLTRQQIDEFVLEHPTLLAEVDALNLIYSSTREVEINLAVSNLLEGIEGYEVIGVTTNSKKRDVLNLKELVKELKMSEDDISQLITDALSEITIRVLDQSKSLIGGLYTSGGDVTVAVCKAIEATGIEVKDEVIPLAVYGRIIGGKYNALPIITKGGLIGDEKSMIKCINYLMTKLSNEYHVKKE